MNTIRQSVKNSESRDIKVALVRGPMVMATTFSNKEAPSIGLAYLSGTVLADGYDCHFIDSLALGLGRYWQIDDYPNFFFQGLNIEETIKKIPPDAAVIGFSVMFSAEWPFQRDFISAVRKQFPHALFVAGGEHITALTEFSLHDCPALDICVRGEEL